MANNRAWFARQFSQETQNPHQDYLNLMLLLGKDAKAGNPERIFAYVDWLVRNNIQLDQSMKTNLASIYQLANEIGHHQIMTKLMNVLKESDVAQKGVKVPQVEIRRSKL